ncbi:hypothetical protein J4227_00920 [Candidatus Woesearchaeota archaeon]|nr:hypothetical protein [Candidatus Woesearchaeota archaeon]
MNKKQMAYQTTRILYGKEDIILLGSAALFGWNSADYLANAQDFMRYAIGGAFGLASLSVGFFAFLTVGTRHYLNKDRKKLENDGASYPLQNSERITIEDADGLENLLERTRAGERKEWGTLLKAYDDKGTTVVTEILHPGIAEAEGLIFFLTGGTGQVNSALARQQGYNGFHHYHPNHGPGWAGAGNFSIGLVDRNKPLDWINLLTFNMPDGPEIIGFNQRFVYVPLEKGSKNELVRADHGKIMEYLGA